MPYKNTADRKAYESLRAERRKADGLCAQCSGQARQGKRQCQQCADRYAKSKQNGGQTE